MSGWEHPSEFTLVLKSTCVVQVTSQWWKWNESHSVVSDSLWPYGLYVHGILQAKILEWVSVPFSRRSFQPRDGTQVSHFEGGFFTSWATREALQHTRPPGPSLLPELAQTHVHWVGDAIQPLSPSSPSAFKLSQHHGLFQWVGSSHLVAKLLELQLQHQSFQWIFRVDFL